MVRQNNILNAAFKLSKNWNPEHVFNEKKIKGKKQKLIK